MSREGKTYHLSPCLWIFAGTKKPTDSDSPKGEDFENRLLMDPLNLIVDASTMPIKKEARIQLAFSLLALVTKTGDKRARMNELDWVKERTRC